MVWAMACGTYEVWLDLEHREVVIHRLPKGESVMGAGFSFSPEWAKHLRERERVYYKCVMNF